MSSVSEGWPPRGPVSGNPGQRGRVPRKCLTIAGSDSGGGAGIQADLKTFAAFGCYGTSAVTALTAQNTRGVSAVHAAPPRFVAEQIDVVLSDIGADAVKTGMLSDGHIVATVAERLAAHRVERVVVDPVMVATTGASLLGKDHERAASEGDSEGRDRSETSPDGPADAVEALRKMLLPLAEVATPNIPEASALVGGAIDSERDAIEAARAILAMGPRWVVLKGGHGEGAEAVDLVVGPDGVVERLVGPRFETTSTHGTGCSFASAMCACLANGMTTPDAARVVKAWLSEAIRLAHPIGGGYGPVHHFHKWW